MATKTTSAESLHAEYAGRLTAVVGLDVTEYGATFAGLASLLRDTSGRLSPLDPNCEWLEEAADHLTAVDLLGDSPKAHGVLKTIDNTLYEAVSELETY